MDVDVDIGIDLSRLDVYVQTRKHTRHVYLPSEAHYIKQQVEERRRAQRSIGNGSHADARL